MSNFLDKIKLYNSRINNFLFHKPLGFLVGTIIVVLLIFSFIIWQIFSPPIAQGKFNLEAISLDVNGISTDTSFTLRSQQPLSSSQVKEILKFEPEINFDVNKIDNSSQSNDVNFYMIKPDNSLNEDKIYQAMINDSNYVDHEYSWAFQTKSPFKITQTHPSNHSNDVPLDTVIEVTFNRENPEHIEDYFEITPNVTGRFEVDGNVARFVPGGDLQDKTVYNVKLKKGLSLESSHDNLENDYEFSFEASNSEYSGEKPYFRFTKDFSEYIPDKRAAIEASFNNLDVDSLSAKIYQFSNDKDFLDSYQGNHNWDLDWSDNNFIAYKELDESKKILSFKPSFIDNDSQKIMEIPELLTSGYYLLDIEYTGKHDRLWLQITPVAHYFSLTHDKGLLWLYNYSKNEPLDSSKISFISDFAQETKISDTNKEGLAEFTTPDLLKEENKDKSNVNFFKVESNGNLTTIIKAVGNDDWNYNGKAEKGDQYWDYLSTDRFVYPITGSIKFWGVVKGRSDDLKQKKVKVALIDYGSVGAKVDKSSILVEQEVMVSQFDTITGELSYKGVSTGYNVVAVIYGDEIISTSAIEVISYSKPAYQINVESSKQVMFAGEKVDFSIKADFFDGTPVQNLKLKYHGYWQDNIDGEITLNDNGEGTFSYTPQYYLDSRSDYWPKTLEFSFSPQLSEEGEIYGKGAVTVFGSDIYMQAFEEKQADDQYKLSLKLNQINLNSDTVVGSGEGLIRSDYIGDSLTNHNFSGQIIKVTYQKIEDGQYYDPIYKVNKKTYRYESKEEKFEDITGQTDSNGMWSAIKKLTKENDVSYKVVFTSTDGQSRNSNDYLYINPSYSNYSTWKDFNVTLVNNSDTNEFSINDKIKLEVKTSDNSKLLSNKTLFYQYQNNINEVSLETGLTKDIEFKKSFIPDVNYRAVVLGPYGFEETNSVLLSYKETDQNLSININSDKEKYRPGEEIKLNLEVKDRDNKPISSELNISAVDEALFHILPYDWQAEILSGLYQDIYVSPISGFSQYAIKQGAEGGGCFTGDTPILLANGSSQAIEKIKVGDEVLTFQGVDNKNLTKAIVQGVSHHLVNQLLVVNGNLEVTPEHILYFNGKWDYAVNIKIGDLLVNSVGETQKVTSLGYKNVLGVEVYNIVVGEYHTYFANNYFVHNAEKGGGERMNFVDTPLYQSLHTDKHGKAEISFKSPDNITAWRISARAYSTDDIIKAGQASKIIQTSLPFFVDATMNNTYLSTDKPEMRLRVFGSDYDSNKQTEFSIKSQTLSLDKKEVSNGSSVNFKLDQMPLGEHEITITAKQGDFSDSVIRKVKIVDNYFSKLESSTYQISDNLSDIKGNDSGYTQLVFSDPGKGKFYQQLKNRSYQDDIRSDQQVAKYYANKLLSQYFDENNPTGELDLTNYSQNGSGISLFTYSDNDLLVSAKIADLSPDNISSANLKSYFYGIVNDKGASLYYKIQSLYGLACLNEPILNKINLIKEIKDLNIEQQIYLALAMAKIGDKENARLIYSKNIAPKLHTQGAQMWLDQEKDTTKRVKLTADIAILVSHLDIQDDLSKLWDYISNHDPQKDLDVLEEVLVAKNGLSYLDKASDASFSYQTGNKTDSVDLKNGKTYSLNLNSEELKNLKFSNIQGEINLVSLYEKSVKPDELSKDNLINLTRQYLVDGKSVNSFSEGDIVLVRLDPNILTNANDGAYQVIDYLPSGLKPISQFYQPDITLNDDCNISWYPVKVVDNAVYFEINKDFDKTNKCSNRTLNYYARVVSKGSYIANPAIIQSLNSLNSLNISSENNVEIK